MDLIYSSVEGKSRSYYLVVLVCALLTLAGLVSFGISYVAGHQVFGSSNVIPWGMPIVLAIYLIGLSAGSLILSSLTYVFGQERYKPIARMAVFLAIVLIFGAMLSIAVDLGRPEKFWRLFMFFVLNNMSSMFAINTILYGGYFGISLVYLGFIFAGKSSYTRIMGIIAVSWAVLVHMGTGAIFGFIAARETWVSPIKPLEFLLAAIVSGLALLIIVSVATMRFSGRDLKKETVTSLGGMLRIFIIVLLVLIVLDKLTHLYAPGREATVFMLTGHFSWMFWALQEGMGAIIPLIILFHPRLNKSVRWTVIASVSVVIGIFFERYYLVIPGAAYPLPLYPGEIEGVWGALGSFPLTSVEIILSVGIFALLVFLFVLGLRYLELLPVSEAGKETAARQEDEISGDSGTPEAGEGEEASENKQGGEEPSTA
ncbi:NrfD/PsrC family molybdoenzyme membrane anchor subunit [Chloroflexota bacterium]